MVLWCLRVLLTRLGLVTARAPGLFAHVASVFGLSQPFEC